MLCTDGRARDHAEGRSWKAGAKRTGALGLNANDNAFVAADSKASCDGLVIARCDEDGQG